MTTKNARRPSRTLSKKNDSRGRRLDWTVHAALNLTVIRRGFSLNVTILPPPGVGWGWSIGAVESPLLDAEFRGAANQQKGLNKIFDDHAHAVLPPQRTLAEAIALAERYVTWWRGSRATHFKCECDGIEKAS